MPTYKTPGVYIEEIDRFPPAVAAVETAIPAFIGFTEKAMDRESDSLTNVPTRITSLLEYEQYFGRAPNQAFSLDVIQHQQAPSDKITSTDVAFKVAPPKIPDYLLYYSMQLFFANGGGACYVVSVGNTSSTAYSSGLFTDAILTLEDHDEPTLYVFPDACSHRVGHVAENSDVADIVDAALRSCARMQDRFTIVDVRNGVVGGTEHFVFEPNDASTWAKVRSLIESFLMLQWRNGGLMGATPEDAFFVKVGLNQTMAEIDILEGRMIVEIGMAVVRPAEFVILRFSHKSAGWVLKPM